MDAVAVERACRLPDRRTGWPSGRYEVHADIGERPLEPSYLPDTERRRNEAPAGVAERPADYGDPSGKRGRELAALRALSRAPGMSLRALKRLIGHYGSGTAALRAVRTVPRAELRALCRSRRGPTTATRKATGPSAIGNAHALFKNMRGKNVRVAACTEPEYPQGLRDLGDPPLLLFLRGRAVPDEKRTIAIVGTRASSSYGLRTAYSMAREAARWGWTVVSGMARGIDAAAHSGALDGGGRSVGVLGAGLDHYYPADNRELYRRMESQGLLLTEFEPSKPPVRSAFPRRNRLIAALSRGVVVVEAGKKSGALNTADHALDLGREVMAVPGRAGDACAAGCLRLLQQGAGLVTGIKDVFDAVGWLHDFAAPAPARPAPATTSAGPATAAAAEAARSPDERQAETEEAPARAREQLILQLLSKRARSPDEVAIELAMPVSRVLRGLGHLELAGWVERRPGGLYAIVPRP